MLEHVMRRMQEGARGRRPTALLAAAAEMGEAPVRLDAATIVVFLPLAFISGVTGGFFKALAVTMVAASRVAALCAFRHPAVAGWLAKKDAEAARKGRGLHGRAAPRLCGAWPRGSRAPTMFAVVDRACSASAVRLDAVPSGFMPKMDEGGFILDYKAQARRGAHRHRRAAAPGRGDRPRDARSRQLFAAHRPAARRRADRSRRGRLLHPPEGRLAARHRGGDGRTSARGAVAGARASRSRPRS